jgi:signal transduction histidine kinase
MKERVTLLGGQLHIESGPDMGTWIRVEIPLEGPPNE